MVEGGWVEKTKEKFKKVEGGGLVSVVLSGPSDLLFLWVVLDVQTACSASSAMEKVLVFCTLVWRI